MPKALNSHRSMAVIIRMMAIMLVIGGSVSPVYAHTAVFNTPPDKYGPYVQDIPDQTIYEGEAFTTIALDAYAYDPDNSDSELTWSVSGNAGLTITIVNRVATITYPEGWAGSETLTFTATDPTKLSGSDTATFTVLAKLPTNHAPIAADDTYTLDEGATLTVFAPGVLENDSDEDGDSLTATLVSGPAHGTLSFAADGSFSYAHDGSETTSDSFTYSVSDGQETSEAATVALTITPVNDWPAAVDDAYSVQEGGTLIIAAPGVLANDTDAEGDTLTASLVSGPAHGTLTFAADGSFTYVHDGTDTTQDSFTYKANDGTDDSASATVVLTIEPANDVPTAVNDAYAVDRGATLTVFAPGVLGNDTDPEDDPLTAALVNGPSHGTLTFAADGSFSYTHDGTYTTQDSFTYKANDGTNDSNVANVVLTINPVNTPPTAVDDAYTVNRGATLTISAPGVLSNDTDADNDPLTAVLVSGPTHGTLTFTADGAFIYTHDGTSGTQDSFTYQANDDTSVSNVATVIITVKNAPPVAKDDAYTTVQGGTLSVFAPGVLANDKDIDSTSLTAVLVSSPAYGTLSFKANGSFTYSHNGGPTTSDSFTYRAYDGKDYSEIATVRITIINDSPVALDDSATTEQGVAVVIDVLANDFDPEDDALTVSYLGTASLTGGAVTCTGAGLCTYTPSAGYNGQDTFSYTVKDTHGGTDTATVTITVYPRTPSPTSAAFKIYLPLAYR